MATIGTYTGGEMGITVRATVSDQPTQYGIWSRVETYFGEKRRSLDLYETRPHAIAMARAHLEALHRDHGDHGIAVSPIQWAEVA